MGTVVPRLTGHPAGGESPLYPILVLPSAGDALHWGAYARRILLYFSYFIGGLIDAEVGGDLALGHALEVDEAPGLLGLLSDGFFCHGCW